MCASHLRRTAPGDFNEQLSRMLKAEAQKEYEKEHSHEEFMNLIGRNYL